MPRTGKRIRTKNLSHEQVREVHRLLGLNLKPRAIAEQLSITEPKIRYQIRKMRGLS